MTNSQAETTSPNAITPSTGGGWLFAGPICSVTAAIFTTIIGIYVLPQFSQTFANFGAQVPLVTRLVIHFYFLIWVVPLALFIIRRFLPPNRRRNIWAGIIGIGSSVAVMPTLVITMYLPIFGLQATM